MLPLRLLFETDLYADNGLAYDVTGVSHIVSTFESIRLTLFNSPKLPE